LRLVVATPILFGVVGIALGEVVYFTVFGVGIAVALWSSFPGWCNAQSKPS